METLNYSQLMNLPEDFDCSKVTEININGCNLKSLQKLNYNENQLSNLDCISNCTSLQKLHCS